MGISFTRPLIIQLEKEIAELESLIRQKKNRRDQALTKIKQLKRDQKLSQSAEDLSSKITRENKLKKEIEQIDDVLAQSTKQLRDKKSLLEKQQSKVQPSRD